MSIEPLKRTAAIGESFGISWPRGDSAIVALKCRFDPVQGKQGIAPVVERIGVVRPQGESTVVACKRRFILALCRLDDGQNMSRVEVIGLDGYNLLAQLLGIRELSGLVGCNGKIEGLGGIRRGARHWTSFSAGATA